MNHVVLKSFSDQTGQHTQGDIIDVSDNRATKLISLGYVGTVKVGKTHPVKLDADSEEIHNALNEAAETIVSKNEEIKTLTEKYDDLDDQFNNLDSAYAKKEKELTAQNEEVERIASAFAGFVSSIKIAKEMTVVKALVAALETIESAK
jgi:DNA repair exonuclease SbcCD ATPase subunit